MDINDVEANLFQRQVLVLRPGWRKRRNYSILPGEGIGERETSIFVTKSTRSRFRSGEPRKDYESIKYSPNSTGSEVAQRILTSS